jgi:hypothetical protein
MRARRFVVLALSYLSRQPRQTARRPRHRRRYVDEPRRAKSAFANRSRRGGRKKARLEMNGIYSDYIKRPLSTRVGLFAADS